KELGFLLDDVEMDTTLDDIRLEPWDDEEVRSLFTTLEFKTLYERIREYDLAPEANTSLVEVTAEHLAIGDEPPATTGVACDSHWFGFASDESRATVAPLEEAISSLKDWLADPQRAKYVHDAKPLYRRALEAQAKVDGLQAD